MIKFIALPPSPAVAEIQARFNKHRTAKISPLDDTGFMLVEFDQYKLKTLTSDPSVTDPKLRTWEYRVYTEEEFKKVFAASQAYVAVDQFYDEEEWDGRIIGGNTLTTADISVDMLVVCDGAFAGIALEPGVTGFDSRRYKNTVHRIGLLSDPPETYPKVKKREAK